MCSSQAPYRGAVQAQGDDINIQINVFGQMLVICLKKIYSPAVLNGDTGANYYKLQENIWRLINLR